MQNSHKSPSWRTSLSNAVTDPRELLALLNLDAGLLEQAEKAAALFPLKVPREFITRMNPGDLRDPLLRQILPLGDELNTVAGYHADPLNEAAANPLPGLLHKYHGRVLLTVTSACAINCRYCFRREFPYQNNTPGSTGWEKVIAYIQQDPTIDEVILSGGDPLASNDATLKNLTTQLATIPHIKRLRIHSRLPIVLPERITPECLDAITHPNLNTVMVVHCNHPNELNTLVHDAIRALKEKNITVLNQTVLLKEINDQADTLIALSEALFKAGILPYYLHVLDKVRGAAHFDLTLEVARKLHWEMTQRLSGYLVPKLVCEVPGAPAKLPVAELELYTG